MTIHPGVTPSESMGVSNHMCFFHRLGPGTLGIFLSLMIAALSWQTSSPSKLQIFHQSSTNEKKSQVTLTQHGIPKIQAFRFFLAMYKLTRENTAHVQVLRVGVRKIRCSLRSVPCWPWASEPPRGSCADHVQPPREARNTGNPQSGETHLMVETNLFFHEQKCSFGS